MSTTCLCKPSPVRLSAYPASPSFVAALARCALQQFQAAPVERLGVGGRGACGRAATSTTPGITCQWG